MVTKMSFALEHNFSGQFLESHHVTERSSLCVAFFFAHDVRQ